MVGLGLVVRAAENELSIARAICEAHGGEISASLPETGGLAVRILLPWHPSDNENLPS